jgi:hypothetical protein
MCTRRIPVKYIGSTPNPVARGPVPEGGCFQRISYSCGRVQGSSSDASDLISLTALPEEALVSPG